MAFSRRDRPARCAARHVVRVFYAAAAALCVGGQQEVSFPVSGLGADLRCVVDGSAALVQCARAAASGLEALRCSNDDGDCLGRELLRLALEGVRGGGVLGDDMASLATAACGGSCASQPEVEAALRVALDETGGYACAGGKVFHPGTLLEDVVQALPGPAVTLNNCSSLSAPLIVLDGRRSAACDADDLLDAALGSLSYNGTLLVRGAAPCSGESGLGGGGLWRAVARLRAASSAAFDVQVGLFDGGVALIRRRPQRGPPTCAPDDWVSLEGHADAPTLLATLVSRRGEPPSTTKGCSSEEASQLGERFKASRCLAVGDDWSVAALLGCPAKDWLRPLLMSRKQGIVAVNVGANKGYSIAKLLSELAPELGVTSASWGAWLRTTDAQFACGWCRDCLEEEAVPAPSCKQQRNLRIHAFEPLRANVDLIRSALSHFGFREQGGTWLRAGVEVVIHQVAVGATRSTALFPALRAGEEVGAVCDSDDCAEMFHGRFDPGAASNFYEVEVRSLDDLLEEQVDLIFVDVEGADPLVLRGGQKTLEQTQLLEFEYHFRGEWAKTSLRQVTAELEGFDCYLQGPHSTLWRLSRGCWDDAFEVRLWSNVVCVKRSNREWHAILERYAVVDPFF